MTLTIIAALSLAAWAYLLLGRGGYWRARESLEPLPEPADWPAVAVIIPARNEAETIGAAIVSHTASDYPGAFSIILVDDASSDGTSDVARHAETTRRSLDVIFAPPLETGWTGKLWAMRAGLDCAREIAPGARYFLFTDADIVHESSVLRRLVGKAENENLALISLMAQLDARGFWGEILIPAFVYFFQQLYPFPQSNDPSSPIAAAAGGCMLVRKEALDAAGGLDSIRDKLIDDCALAKRLKIHGAPTARIWIGLSHGEVSSLRDNHQLSSIWTMVARTAFAQLGHAWPLLIGTMLGMVLIYGAPPAIALTYPAHVNAQAGAIALAAWIAMATSYLPTARVYGLPPWKTAFLPLAAALYAAMTLHSGIAHARGRGGLWKGRTYP